MPRFRLAAPLLAAALAVTAGCGPGPTPGGAVDPIAELAARPSLEQTVARYEQMQQRVFDALSAELGPFRWERYRAGRAAGCGADFPADAGGRTQSLASWGFDGAIPDDRWPRAVQVVTEITADYGFGPPRVLADGPGHHDIAGVDGFGGNYQFGTAVETVWRVATGCHLAEAGPTGSRSPTS